MLGHYLKIYLSKLQFQYVLCSYSEYQISIPLSELFFYFEIIGFF